MTDSVSYRRPESVLVLVYTQDAQVLLMQRVDPPDFWQSVTGGLEKDELPLAGAHRELVEETGLDLVEHSAVLTDHQCSSIFEIKGAWRSRYHPDQTHNREHLFSVQLPKCVDVKLDASEHSRYQLEDIVLSAQYRS